MKTYSSEKRGGTDKLQHPVRTVLSVSLSWLPSLLPAQPWAAPLRWPGQRRDLPGGGIRVLGIKGLRWGVRCGGAAAAQVCVGTVGLFLAIL